MAKDICGRETEAFITEAFSMKTTTASGSLTFRARPDSLDYTNIDVELSTPASGEHEDIVWLEVTRRSALPAEAWGYDGHAQIVLKRDELELLIATLQRAVAEARAAGVLTA